MRKWDFMTESFLSHRVLLVFLRSYRIGIWVCFGLGHATTDTIYCNWLQYSPLQGAYTVMSDW